MKRNKVHAELFRLTLPWHDKLDSHPALAVLLTPGLQQQAPELHAGILQYFAVQAAQVAQWPQFLQQMECLPDDKTSLSAAATAAVGVFTHFLATLDETAHGR
jgi:hypothetical protein